MNTRHLVQFPPEGCTPSETVPMLSCVIAYSKNCHFRVLIMIRISQAHVFLKDYVHIHRMGSHFAGGCRSIFRTLVKKLRPPFCKLLEACRRNKIKRSQISQLLMKMLFYRDLWRKVSDQHIHNKK